MEDPTHNRYLVLSPYTDDVSNRPQTVEERSLKESNRKKRRNKKKASLQKERDREEQASRLDAIKSWRRWDNNRRAKEIELAIMESWGGPEFYCGGVVECTCFD